MTININGNTDIAKIRINNGGSLVFTAGFSTLTINNGDSLVLMDGSVIDGNGQSNVFIDLQNSSNFDILADGTGSRITGITRFLTTNTDTTFLHGSGDISVASFFRLSGTSPTFVNNSTGSLNVGLVDITSSAVEFINNGSVNITATFRMNSTNASIINNDSISIGTNLSSNNNSDDGNTITNSGFFSVGATIDPSDADWTIDNSGTFVHVGDFANVGGTENFNNLNGGTWYSGASDHTGVILNCDDAVNTFIYNGAGAQSVFIPSDGEYYNLGFENTGARTLGGAIIVQDTLFQTAGYTDINSNSMTIGTAPASAGTVVFTDGGFYGGDFTRYIDAATIADGNAAGLFPMANNSNEIRPIYVSAPAVAPSPGGTITISTSDVTTVSDVSVADDVTILRRYDGFWTVSSGGGITGGTYNLRGSGLGFGEIGDVTDLRLMLSGSVVGSPGTNGGTTMNPEVNRTGLTLANLANDFYVGSVAAIRSPLPITLISFEAACHSGNTELNWRILRDFENENIRLMGSLNGSDWETLSFEEKGEDKNGVLEYSYSDRSASVPEYFQLVNQDNEILAEKKVTCDAFNRIRLFPNPSDGNFEIEGIMGIDMIEIWDAQGNLITSRDKRKERCSSDSFSMGLENGIYFVVLFGENGEVIKSKLLIAD